MLTPIADAFTEDLSQKRRTDSQPAQPVPMRNALAASLMRIYNSMKEHAPHDRSAVYKLAAETLERDEAENAAMIDELVRAGYRDVGPRINAALIKRLLGYISPGT